MLRGTKSWGTMIIVLWPRIDRFRVSIGDCATEREKIFCSIIFHHQALIGVRRVLIVFMLNSPLSYAVKIVCGHKTKRLIKLHSQIKNTGLTTHASHKQMYSGYAYNFDRTLVWRIDDCTIPDNHQCIAYWIYHEVCVSFRCFHFMADTGCRPLGGAAE